MNRFARWSRNAAWPVLGLLATAAPLHAQDVVRIGVAVPLSGSAEKLGHGVWGGAQLAADDINAAGGIKAGERSYRLELVSIDDRAAARIAADVATQLVRRGAVAVVGHLNSGSSIEAAPVYAAAGVAQVSPASANPYFTRMGYETTNRVVGNDRRQGEIMALHAVKRMNLKAIAVISDGTDYGNTLTRAFINAAGLLGGRIVFDGTIPPEAQNIAGALATVKALNPDALYFGGMVEQAAALAGAMRDLKLGGPLLTGDGACIEDFIAAAKDAAANMHCTVGEPGIDHLPQATAFEARYRKRFGHPSTVYAPYAYDALQVIAQAMRDAGSVQPRAITEALRGVKLTGITGPIAFDRHGDLVDAPFSVFRSDGKRLRFVETVR